MTRILILSCGLLFLAGVAFGQAGHIGLYSDPALSSCNLANPTGSVQVFVAHQFTTGARESEFKVQNNGTGLLYVVETFPWISAGDTQTGIAVTYNGACVQSPILVTEITYFAAQPSPVCSFLSVVRHPQNAQIKGKDCSLQATAPSGGVLTVNGDSHCLCVLAIAAEETNWGKIKAMYD